MIFSKLNKRISGFLSNRPIWVFAVFVSLTAFCTYSCMYAFRKPFTIGVFDGHNFLGIHFKLWLIGAQVLGYTLSKFLGIKFVSELKKSGRAISIIFLVGISELSLFLLSWVPSPWNIVCMFFNGLPLGMIWGIVFSYLEGRATTELLGAILSASFILASGLVKSVGKFLMLHFQLNEFSMPYITGLLFLIPLLIFVWLLDCSPEPTEHDILLRTKRAPMDKSQRIAFLKEFLPGIVLFILAYLILTVFREIRDNFANEIWTSLGLGKDPSIFTTTEIPVMFLTLFILSLLICIKSNIKAFKSILWIIIFGFFLIMLSSLLYVFGKISGIWWMIISGTGIYLGYIPFNAFLFERMISSFQYTSNIGFVMYLSDAFGYLGSLGVVIVKNFVSPQISWIHFFSQTTIWSSMAGIVLIGLSINYFSKKYNSQYQHQNIQHGNRYTKFSGKPLFAFNSRTTIDQ